ncbi:MAG: riboflavin kinase, partial [Bacteroidales bacterium]|nr:riboflavin kinase [Bacteroidales bacterium]
VVVELGIEKYKGICNIGVRPTVGDSNALSIETHILNFEEDIYGLDLKIDFIRRLRDEQRFDSLEQLKQQLQRDKEAVNDFFANFATL